MLELVGVSRALGGFDLARSAGVHWAPRWQAVPLPPAQHHSARQPKSFDQACAAAPGKRQLVALVSRFQAWRGHPSLRQRNVVKVLALLKTLAKNLLRCNGFVQSAPL